MASSANWPSQAFGRVDPSGSAGYINYGYLYNSERRYGVFWEVTQTNPGYVFDHWTFELGWYSDNQEWFPGAQAILESQRNNIRVELADCFYNPDEFKYLANSYVRATAHFKSTGGGGEDEPEYEKVPGSGRLIYDNVTGRLMFGGGGVPMYDGGRMVKKES